MMAGMSSPSLFAQRFVIPATSSFSLEEVAMMGFGHRHADRFDGVMRLAFYADGDDYEHHGAVEVRSVAEGVECRLVAGDPATLRAQVARVLSSDHDGVVSDEIGQLRLLLRPKDRQQRGTANSFHKLEYSYQFAEIKEEESCVR